MTRIQPPWRRMGLVVTGMMFTAFLGSAERAAAQSGPQSCSVTSDLARLELPLSRMAQRLADEGPVKIIAIGLDRRRGCELPRRLVPEPAPGRAQDPFSSRFDQSDEPRGRG